MGKRFTGMNPVLVAQLKNRLQHFQQHPNDPPASWGSLLPMATLSMVDDSLLAAARRIHGDQQTNYAIQAVLLQDELALNRCGNPGILIYI